MFKNFFKIAVRNLKKQKFYSLLNITGLAVGMTVCLLIILFVQNELSYDKYNKKADRIYRVATKGSFGGKEFDLAVAPAPLAETFVRDFPEVKTATRFRKRGNYVITYGDKSLKEENLVFADPEVFDVFTLPLIKGDPKTALEKPNSLVISEKAAEKYFGNENPIGKSVTLDHRTDYQITGVMKEIPKTSHFHFDVFASMSSIDESKNTRWLSQNFQTYIVLKKGADPKNLETKFHDFTLKYMEPQLEKFMGISFAQFEKQGNGLTMYLQPLTDIHLYSQISSELGTNSDIKYVYVFSAIAIFILLIACVNFMNLSTARSAGRAKEVGIRKVLGSFKKHLITQFLSESMLLSLIAVVLALIMTSIALPYFNSLAGKEIEFSVLDNFGIIIAVLFITLFVGLLAGSYPAFFISAFRPVEVLKGKLKSGTKSGLLRSGLVVFQFAASIILIVGTMVVFNQLNYIQNKKLGYKKDHVLIVHDAWLLGDQTEIFKKEVKRDPEILNATVSSFLPVPSSRSTTAFFAEGKLNSDQTTSIQNWRVDYDYINTLGMKIIKGRDFSKEFSTDSSAIIVNETAVKQFGLGENPIGKRLGGFLSADNSVTFFNVIGVVKNFHFESLHKKIEPLVMFLNPSSSEAAIRINSENLPKTVAKIKNTWNKLSSGQPFDYTFMEDSFNDVYRAEQRIGSIFSIFAGLAIFIGCLGLFGLAAFTAEQRTKEIGVRKVLGASVANIVYLLSKEFGKLILVSFVIAVPVSYYFMNSWLQDFAFRESISVTTFILAGMIAFMIALLTVSYHAIKTALSNPIKSLRYE